MLEQWIPCCAGTWYVKFVTTRERRLATVRQPSMASRVPEQSGKWPRDTAELGALAYDTRAESVLQLRVRRHGWRLERSEEHTDRGGYRIVDEDDGSIVIGEGFDLDLDDVKVWLE
jgi:hypothetical protein